MNFINNNKWLSLLVICIGGGIAYILPYIQYSFYEPLREGLNLSHSQMGDLMSVLGITSSVCYLIGGIFADKFNVKWLVSISLAGTGLLGFWFATFPSYSELVIIMVLFAITTILLYWPAMIKAVKLLSSEGEYGRMFGFREAGFGLFAFIFTQIGTWFVFNKTAGVEGARDIIIFYSMIYIFAGVISFLFLPSSKQTTDAENTEDNVSVLECIQYVIKIPSVWLIGLTIFCLYTVYSPGLGKLGPYFTEILGFDDASSASIMSIRMYLIQFIAAATGGLLADKMSSIVKFIMISTTCLIVSLTFFVILPATAEYIVMIVISVFIISAIMYSLTGTYMAPVSEVSIPNKYLGTAIGLISFIGYLPEAFMWSVFGRMLGDNPDEAAFKSIFIACIGFAIVGLILSVVTYRFIVNKRDKAPADMAIN